MSSQGASGVHQARDGLTALPVRSGARRVMAQGIPEDGAGWDAEALERAARLASDLVTADLAPGVMFCLGDRSGGHPPTCVGRLRPERGSPPLTADAVFPVASLTKPVTAAAILMLVERGLLSLHDRAARFVREFVGAGRDEVRVIHLLTHTSGLPNLPPNNVELRMAHRPLSDFLAAACAAPLLFEPGTAVSYQGLGFVLLGEMVRAVTGSSLAEFLDRELFGPLGMADTALGLRPGMASRLAKIRMPAEYQDSDWHWNSAYWHTLGAPWTGLITTATDYIRFCRMMLNDGTLEGRRLLSPVTVRAMTSNRLRDLPRLPEVEARCRPWGLGWRLNWPGEPSCFCDLLGPEAFGHSGASGTLCWLDPGRGVCCVILANQARDGDNRLWPCLSNALAAALPGPGSLGLTPIAQALIDV